MLAALLAGGCDREAPMFAIRGVQLQTEQENELVGSMFWKGAIVMTNPGGDSAQRHRVLLRIETLGGKSRVDTTFEAVDVRGGSGPFSLYAGTFFADEKRRLARHDTIRYIARIIGFRTLSNSTPTHLSRIKVEGVERIQQYSEGGTRYLHRGLVVAVGDASESQSLYDVDLTLRRTGGGAIIFDPDTAMDPFAAILRRRRSWTGDSLRLKVLVAGGVGAYEVEGSYRGPPDEYDRIYNDRSWTPEEVRPTVTAAFKFRPLTTNAVPIR